MKRNSCLPAVVLAVFLKNILYAGDLSSGDWPKMTLKHNKKDGDPVNIVLLGSKDDLLGAMASAGWSVSDHLTVRTLAHEIESIVASRAYKNAPMSGLYLFGRKQDIAFEQLAGKNPKHRHHVRFWGSQVHGIAKPAWFGAATYDRSIGLSRYNGEITHHIAPDIDLERDKIVDDLLAAGKLEKLSHAEGIGLTFGSRNGEGDLYYTDGEIAVCYLAAASSVNAGGAVIEQRTVIADHKLRIWKFIKTKILYKVF